jgi:hypothetical protein
MEEDKKPETDGQEAEAIGETPTAVKEGEALPSSDPVP